jgi:hypothetical protein
MNTRKYPRSLVEAFGPYANGPIHPKTDHKDNADKIIVWIGAVVLIALFASLLFG